MNKKFWHSGYIISLLIVVLLVFSDFNSYVDTALLVLFSIILGVSHIQLLHQKMYDTDINYKRNINDERLTIIKEKAGNIVNIITLLLLALATVLFIGLEYTIPAIITGIIAAIQPIVLIIVTYQLEKRM